MNKFKKIVAKIITRPESLHFREIRLLMMKLGFDFIGKTGSHERFHHREKNIYLVVPVHNNECKKFYKKMISSVLYKEFDLHA